MELREGTLLENTLLTAKDLIERLKLQPHPEGGFYREVYRSKESVAQEALPSRYTGDRSFATSIYFLLTGDRFSTLHRLKSDEIWHFYLGDPVEITMLHEDGHLERKTLGAQVTEGQQFQIVIPHGCWFGARVTDTSGFVLMGCTVAPGFDFDDFELANRDELINQFSHHETIIRALTGQ